jgi:hypothetical protein
MDPNSSSQQEPNPWEQIRAGLIAFASLRAQVESQFVRPLREFLDATRERWEPVLRLAQRVQTLSPDERRAFAEVLQTVLADHLARQYQDESKLTSLLARRGWLRVEHYLSAAEINGALEFTNDSEVDEFIVAHFSADNCALLRRVTDRWRSVPYLSARQAIIDDALQAHTDGMFALSIPALLPFVDGIAEDLVTQLGRIDQVQIEQGAKRAKENTVKKVARLWDLGRKTPSSQVVKEVVDNMAYKQFKKGGDIHLLFNRHAVLHGMTPDYGTSANSVRAFLLLDAYVGMYLSIVAAKAFYSKIAPDASESPGLC